MTEQKSKRAMAAIVGQLFSRMNSLQGLLGQSEKDLAARYAEESEQHDRHLSDLELRAAKTPGRYRIKYIRPLPESDQFRIRFEVFIDGVIVETFRELHAYEVEWRDESVIPEVEVFADGRYKAVLQRITFDRNERVAV